MCVGIPGRVVAISTEHDFRIGQVDFGGVCKQVCLQQVPEIAVGDYALVHAGFALTHLDEEEARGVFNLLERMDELDDLCRGGSDEVPRRVP